MKKITATLGMLIGFFCLMLLINTTSATVNVEITPNAAGDETNILNEVPDGTPHWQIVSDISTSTYLYIYNDDSQVFYRDFFNLGSFSGEGAISYIKISVSSKGSYMGGSSGRIRISTKSGGTINETATILTSTYDDGYVTTTRYFTHDKSDGNLWEWSDIPDLQVGISGWSDPATSRGERFAWVRVWIGAENNWITTGDSSEVEETTATLDFSGYSDETVTVGFWVNDASPADGDNYDFNFTGGGYSGSPFSGSYNAVGLSPGVHYYYRAWWKTATDFGSSSVENDFLTKPLAPTNLVFSYTTTDVTLSWDNGTGMDKSIVVVKIGGYPTDVGDGTIVYNDTLNTTIDTGFASWTSRYYRVWSYAESGALSKLSDGYVENNTQVATFNVIFPDFLKVGEYIDARGMIMDGNGRAIVEFVAMTTVNYAINDSIAIGPAYWNCSNGNYECTIPTTSILPGEYEIVIVFTNSTGSNFTFRHTLYLSINPGGGTYSDAILHISWYNTNIGLGLPDETLQLFVNGLRKISKTYYTYIGENVSIQVKDYYDVTLYYGNVTMSGTYNFIDMGLTFHEYDFSNTRNEYYVVGFLRQGAGRWFEKIVPSHGQDSFLLPTGQYSIHVYNSDLTVDVIWNEQVNRSRGYLIQGDDVTLVIQGLSVVGDDILEIRYTLDDALTPDVRVISKNPPMIYSIFDLEGMALGIGPIKICPNLVTIATTKNDSYGQSISSIPWIPKNDTVLNGIITVLKDTLYISGPGSVTYVNITYTDTGELLSNTSYIPAKVDLYGENITIEASDSIAVRREVKYHQVRKFDWNYWAHNGTYTMGESVINSMNIPLYDVYSIVELVEDSNPDFSTMVFRDMSNDGIVMEKGTDYDATETSIHFYWMGMAALEERGFTITYRRHFYESYDYSEAYYDVGTYHTEKLNGFAYNAFDINWLNDKSQIFRGALYVKLNFDIPDARLDAGSVRIYDEGNQQELDKQLFIPTEDFIIISADAMGDVNPGGGRKFTVYFSIKEFPGANPETYLTGTILFKFGAVPITLFLIFQLIGMGLIFGGVGLYVFPSKRKKKDPKSVGQLAQIIFVLGCFIIFMIYILHANGV